MRENEMYVMYDISSSCILKSNGASIHKMNKYWNKFSEYVAVS